MIDGQTYPYESKELAALEWVIAHFTLPRIVYTSRALSSDSFAVKKEGEHGHETIRPRTED